VNRSVLGRRAAPAAVALALCLGLAACGGGDAGESTSSGSGEGEALSGSINVDGSSTVFPLAEAAAELFQEEQPDVQVTVGQSGTGGGFQKFCNGETDISTASRPIKDEEIAACEANGITYQELQVANDALTVVVNSENDWATCLTVDQLAAIWGPDSTVTNWNQVDPSFPDEALQLFGPGTDSGTFDYFTAEINGEEGASRTDYQASEDDNVLVQGVSGDPNALGYFGFAYYEINQDTLKALAVDGVEPNTQTIRSAEYPLSRPLFIYVSKKAAETKPEVREFIEFTMQGSIPLIREVKYLPLPDRAYEQGLKKFKDGKTGSVFGGVPEVGISIDEVVNRESKS
jgi:phosphate transport system substrate-binding protein